MTIRSSNARPIEATEPEQPHEHGREAAERPSNARPRQTDQSRHAPARRSAERSSNARPVTPDAHPGRVSADRPSNAQPREYRGAIISIQIADGPSRERVRSANVYDIGETVTLTCTLDGAQGTETIACRVLAPDDTTTAPEATAVAAWMDGNASATKGQATTTPTIAGDHWYAFDVHDTNGHLLATAERHFVVRKQRVPR